MDRLNLDDKGSSMRSYKSPGQFFFKMKKKPAQQEVLDNIQDYSEEDIDNLSGPHFPQWIKDELKELVKRGSKVSAEHEAERIAALMTAKTSVPRVPVVIPDSHPEERGGSGVFDISKKITADIFAPAKTKNGTIFDSSPEVNKHEEIPGFEEHMNRVRRMRSQ